MNLKHISTAVAVAATTVAAFADIKINDNLTISGYAAGAYMNYKPNNATSVDSLFDASKPIPGGGDSNDVYTKFTMNFKPVTGVISFNYFPNVGGNSEFTVLDAYAAIDAGGGTTVTLGKFLSYLGYESFYPSLMDQITYANGDFLAPIPGYHSGAKIDFAPTKEVGAGLAVVDSVYSPFGGTRGDGELKHNGGLEAYLTYTGIANLTLWGGIAHDTKGGFEPHSVTTLDFWASYQLTKEARVAAEFVSKDGGYNALAGYNNKGTNWITFLNYTFSDKVSSTFRVSGEEMSNGGPKFVKFTVSPTYNVNANFLVRAEYSYYDYNRYTAKHADFFGVQAVLKF
jgi:hypothetical protein